MGVVHINGLPCHGIHLVNNRRQCGNQIQIKLSLQTLLNDFHVEHTQKSAAETKAQRHRGLGLEGQRGIVQLEFFQCIAQVGVFGAVLGINTAVNHGLCGTITGQCFACRTGSLGDGIAHLGVVHILDGSGEITDLTGNQFFTLAHTKGLQIAALQHLIGGTGSHHLHLHTGTHGAFFNTEIYNNTHIGVILAVEDQRLQRCLGIAAGGRHIGHNIFQNSRNIDAHFCRNLGCIGGRQTDDILHLLLGLHRVGCRQVNLVEHRQDLEISIQCQIGVSQSLRLHTLGGVHHQHSTFTGGQTAGNLIVKVHVTRGVDQIHLIGLAILCLIVHSNGTSFDRNTALLLQFHVVQHLGMQLSLRDRFGQFQQTVCQSGLAMVDMGNNGKIANFRAISHNPRS